MIGRRRFLGVAGLSGYALAIGVRAQAPDGVKRIGVLVQGPPTMRLQPPPATIEAMRERGWVVGRNLSYDIRSWERPDQLPGIVDELVRAKVDLIATFSTPASRAAKSATATIPILFEVGDDPVSTGLVTSLARPGGNLTGFVYGLLEEKLLEMLKRAVPKAKRVVIPVAAPSAAARAAAEALGVEIIVIEVKDSAGLDAFFESLRKVRPDGVVVPNVQWMNVTARSFAEGVRKAGLPAIAWADEFAKAGGLLSYRPDGMLERRAAMTDALLRGANPRDLPVQMPVEFRLTVNLAAAKALGLTLPHELLVLAREEDILGREK
jgi:putative ABC transport system substrate-binding protein